MADDGNGGCWGNRIFGIAQAVVGASLVVKGLRHAGWLPPGTDAQALFGQLSSPSKRPGNGKVVQRVVTVNPLTIEANARHIIDIIRRDSLTAEVREDALGVLTRKCGDSYCVPEKDYNAEVNALWDALVNVASPLSMRYVMDHYDTDQFHSNRVLRRWGGSDCFVHGTLVLRDGHQLVPIESLRVGDKIWGRDRWSEVRNTWSKGVLPTWLVCLNNGSTMRLTPDHHVWVAVCDRHVARVVTQPCSCRVETRRLARVAVRDLRSGDVMLQPDRVAWGTDTMDPVRSEIEGLYLSDGWSSGKHANDGNVNDFCISGLDGNDGSAKRNKEAQKLLVKAYCDANGISAYWHRKYIGVHDKAWARRMHACGAHAWEKRAASINLDEGAGRALLRGILADAGKNTSRGLTLTTTSRALFLQARVLAKMAGITCGEQYLENHGGLGSHPIWRLTLRDASPGRTSKLLRVRDVIQDNEPHECCDIETDDHMVWLPEADCTTSQCDDMVVRLGALLRSVGYPLKLRIIAEKDPDHGDPWSHIYLKVGLPPRAPTLWKALDLAVVPHVRPGWEVPGAEQCFKTGKPHGVIMRVKDFDV